MILIKIMCNEVYLDFIFLLLSLAKVPLLAYNSITKQTPRSMWTLMPLWYWHIPAIMTEQRTWFDIDVKISRDNECFEIY